MSNSSLLYLDHDKIISDYLGEIIIYQFLSGVKQLDITIKKLLVGQMRCVLLININELVKVL